MMKKLLALLLCLMLAAIPAISLADSAEAKIVYAISDDPEQMDPTLNSYSRSSMVLGITSAIHRNSWADWGSMVFATVGISVPVFVIAVLLLYLFSVWLKWLPTFGLTSWKHYILPVACLSFNPIAYIARQTRSSMLEVMEQDYIRTARAKGVPELWVVLRHALKNAIMPVVTYLGPLIAGLLTGSFVVERLYAIPGIGRDFVTSISDRDYTMIMGITIFFGIFVIICNLIVDIAYAIIDPRVKITD